MKRREPLSALELLEYYTVLREAVFKLGQCIGEVAPYVPDDYRGELRATREAAAAFYLIVQRVEQRLRLGHLESDLVDVDAYYN